MALSLYCAPTSPLARACVVLTELLKIPVQLQNVNLASGEQFSSEFVKKNPMHTVPVLEVGDVVITDSHAILTYLVNKYGKEDCLYPKDLEKRALVDSMLHFECGTLFPRLRAAAREIVYYGQTKNTDEQMSQLTEAYGFVETFLTLNRWLVGDHMTVADIITAATLTNSNVVLPIDRERYCKITAYIEKMYEVPEFKKINLPGVQAYVDRFNGKLRENIEKSKSN